MADKKNIGKGHFDITEGSVKHVYVTKNDALSVFQIMKII
jgi:hypothetical protein